jgi:predicted N-acetyltransferase YhbS
LILRPAAVYEADHLSALALRSKAHWGYDKKFLAACKPELTISQKEVAELPVFVADENGTAKGFYALDLIAKDVIELTFLFVEPEWIGRGVGARLFTHACEKARQLGGRRLVIHGDPNAAPFYFSCGAHQNGTVPSGSIAGRVLPLFELDLTRDNPAVRVVDLTERPTVIGTLVDWFASEWPEYARRRGRNGLQQDFEDALAAEPLPRVWLAVSDRTPVGTVALRETSVCSHAVRSPWLAGLYVAPEMRGQGIGNLLVFTLLSHASGLGYREIFAGIRRRGRLFCDPDWEELERTDVHGESVLIVRKQLSSL